MPSRGMRWRRTRCLGGRLRRGLLNPALTRIRRRVVLPMSMPSRSAQQLAQVGVVDPGVPGTSQTNYTGHHGIGRCVGWPAAPVSVSNGGGAPSPGKPPGCAWCGEWLTPISVSCLVQCQCAPPANCSEPEVLPVLFESKSHSPWGECDIYAGQLVRTSSLDIDIVAVEKCTVRCHP